MTAYMAYIFFDLNPLSNRRKSAIANSGPTKCTPKLPA